MDLSVILGGAILVLIFYWYWYRSSTYWQRRNVEYCKPIPVFGNILDIFLLRCNIAEKLSHFYRKSKGRYIGIFMLHRPAVVVKDPLLMKEIFQKHFEDFPNRSVSDAVDELVNPDAFTGLFISKHDTWKFIRNTVKTHFSFFKLKEVMDNLLDCTDNMSRFIVQNHENGCVNLRNVCIRFSIDALCSLLFGFDGNCFQDEESPVLSLGKKFFDYKIFRRGSQIAMTFISPLITKILSLEFFEERSSKEWMNIIMNIVEERKADAQERNDYVGSLLNANYTGRGNLLVGTVETFVAGYEAITSTLCFAFFELAENQEIQQKLRSDVEHILQGKKSITYEELNQMPYLELFFKELVRKYPLVPFMERKCSRTVTLEGLTIEEGISVYIPILALHHDPKYYKNPDHFSPERFSGEINPSAYIPFGLGPRTCLAKRYSQIVIKYCLAQLIRKFEFKTCPGTPEKVIFNTKGFTLQPAVDILLQAREI